LFIIFVFCKNKPDWASSRLDSTAYLVKNRVQIGQKITFFSQKHAELLHWGLFFTPKTIFAQKK
jgi:hypothetical protein